MKTSLILLLSLVYLSCSQPEFKADLGSGGPQTYNSKNPGDRKNNYGNNVIGDQKTDPNADLVADVTGGGLLKNNGFDCKSTKQGYIGKVYKLPVGQSYLPDFSKMTPLGYIDSPQLNVKPRDWDKGFPGVPNLIEWFGIEFFGVLSVPATDTYYFRTNSDDGSKIYIDNQLVLNNDGIHEPRVVTSSAVQLTQGPHRIKIEWYQGPKREIALQAYWSRGNASNFKIMNIEITSGDNCTGNKLGTFK